MELNTNDAVAFLKDLFDEKAKSNSRFSLRAFAKQLGITPSGLSQILTRKKKLSIDRAHDFARRLKLNPKASKLFLTLIEIDSASNDLRKSELIESLDQLDRTRLIQNLTVDQFRFLSSWYGIPVLEMITECNPLITNSQMAKRLGVSLAEVDATLERLERLEVIEKGDPKPGSPRYKRVKPNIIADSPLPSEAHRQYYRQVMEKADASLETQAPKERISGAQAFAVDPAQVEELRQLTNQYLDSLQELANRGKNKTEIYQAVTHVFRLTEPFRSKS